MAPDFEDEIDVVVRSGSSGSRRWRCAVMGQGAFWLLTGGPVLADGALPSECIGSLRHLPPSSRKEPSSDISGVQPKSFALQFLDIVSFEEVGLCHC
jgi:hypothetical protein